MPNAGFGTKRAPDCRRALQLTTTQRTRPRCSMKSSVAMPLPTGKQEHETKSNAHASELDLTLFVGSEKSQWYAT